MSKQCTNALLKKYSDAKQLTFPTSSYFILRIALFSLIGKFVKVTQLKIGYFARAVIESEDVDETASSDVVLGVRKRWRPACSTVASCRRKILFPSQP